MRRARVQDRDAQDDAVDDEVGEQHCGGEDADPERKSPATERRTVGSKSISHAEVKHCHRPTEREYNGPLARIGGESHQKRQCEDHADQATLHGYIAQ